MSSSPSCHKGFWGCFSQALETTVYISFMTMTIISFGAVLALETVDHDHDHHQFWGCFGVLAGGWVRSASGNVGSCRRMHRSICSIDHPLYIDRKIATIYGKSIFLIENLKHILKHIFFTWMHFRHNTKKSSFFIKQILCSIYLNFSYRRPAAKISNMLIHI